MVDKGQIKLKEENMNKDENKDKVDASKKSAIKSMNDKVAQN